MRGSLGVTNAAGETRESRNKRKNNDERVKKIGKIRIEKIWIGQRSWSEWRALGKISERMVYAC